MESLSIIQRYMEGVLEADGFIREMDSRMIMMQLEE